jgi:hypothetical protein
MFGWYLLKSKYFVFLMFFFVVSLPDYMVMGYSVFVFFFNCVIVVKVDIFDIRDEVCFGKKALKIYEKD